jgi:hypothetical protein
MLPGFTAIAVPFAATLVSTIFLGWVLIFGGVASRSTRPQPDLAWLVGCAQRRVTWWRGRAVFLYRRHAHAHAGARRVLHGGRRVPGSSAPQAAPRDVERWGFLPSTASSRWRSAS